MLGHIHPHPLKSALSISAIALTALSMGGCNPQESPVDFAVSVPAPNVIGFQATLRQHYGLGLGGSFVLPENVGEIILTPESPQSGFGLGLNLNTRAFLRDTWVGFQEVRALPTG